MNNIRIAHESPKSIFKQVQSSTDYDYALVNLLEEDPEYLKLFKEAKAAGREIILDNAIFELGTAFDPEKFAEWILELQPDWYIVPDVLEDGIQTCAQMADWLKKYVTLPGKKIGVVQGKTYEEIEACYRCMDTVANVDMIAISFDYSYYEKTFPHPNKYVSWTMGRVLLLGKLLRDGIINTSKKHHLLGVALPLEGKFYGGYDWIYSIDTSSPVVHSIKKIKYQKNFGLYTKESQKLFEMINEPLENIDTELLNYNIEEFKKYWNLDTLK